MRKRYVRASAVRGGRQSKTCSPGCSERVCDQTVLSVRRPVATASTVTLAGLSSAKRRTARSSRRPAETVARRSESPAHVPAPPTRSPRRRGPVVVARAPSGRASSASAPAPAARRRERRVRMAPPDFAPEPAVPAALGGVRDRCYNPHMEFRLLGPVGSSETALPCRYRAASSGRCSPRCSSAPGRPCPSTGWSISSGAAARPPPRSGRSTTSSPSSGGSWGRRGPPVPPATPSPSRRSSSTCGSSSGCSPPAVRVMRWPLARAGARRPRG